MTVTLRPDDFLWLTWVEAVIFVLYGYNLWRSWGLYRQERSRRAVRGLFVATLLQLGMLRILFGTTARALPDQPIWTTLNAITAPLLSLMLVSGAFVLIWTWRHRQ